MVYASKTNKIHILSETLYTGTCIHVVATKRNTERAQCDEQLTDPNECGMRV